MIGWMDNVYNGCVYIWMDGGRRSRNVVRNPHSQACEMITEDQTEAECQPAEPYLG